MLLSSEQKLGLIQDLQMLMGSVHDFQNSILTRILLTKIQTIVKIF